jgi:hypothetical protein
MPSIFDNLFGMSGVGGLGDDLRSQVTDETDELKKRRQQMLGSVSSSLGKSGLGSVTQTLGGYTAGGLGGLRGG